MITCPNCHAQVVTAADVEVDMSQISDAAQAHAAPMPMPMPMPPRRSRSKTILLIFAVAVLPVLVSLGSFVNYGINYRQMHALEQIATQVSSAVTGAASLCIVVPARKTNGAAP